MNWLAPNGPAPDNGGTLILTFTTPVSSVGSFFVDDQLPVMVTAFDGGDVVVGSLVSDGSPAGFDSWAFSHAPGMSRVTLEGGSFAPGSTDGWGIDDLRFEPVAGVPDGGSTLALLLPGGLEILAARRRFRAFW